MKTFLVPTDFSVNAEHALSFATGLAKDMNAKIILLHAFQVTLEAGAVPYSLLDLEKKEMKTDAEVKLRTMCIKTDRAGVAVESHAREGNATELILKEARKIKADLVIMGAKGAGGIAGAIFGSTVTSIIEEAKCPVLAVPEDSLYKPFKKITYASDYRQEDIGCISKLIDMMSPLHVQVNVLHVSEEGTPAEQEKKLMMGFMNKLTKKTGYNNLSFQVIHGDHVGKRLETYVDNASANMLAMTTHHKSLAEGLFKTSITKKLARYNAIPLMAFH